MNIERHIMKSKNFEYLRERNSELADLGGFAEVHVRTDPGASLIRLRQFGENLVADFFCEKQIQRPLPGNFNDMLEVIREDNIAPAVVLDKLHFLRTTGNKAVHGRNINMTVQTAEDALRTAFELGKWFNISVYNDNSANELEFCLLAEETKGKLKREKKEALQQIFKQQQKMDALVKQLDEERKKVVAEQKSKEELKLILEQTSSAADTLKFDEATTRKLLIDQQLVQAGWNVGANGKDTADVKQEFEVDGQPTTTGKGFVDYVLWDNVAGKPLAIVEAKKTSLDPDKGIKQASLYADALAKKYNQKPVSFCTNGYEILICDEEKGFIPRKIYGFYAKESVKRLLWQNGSRKFLPGINPKETIIDRSYQILAVKNVCEKFNLNRRKALIVLATGTGKTRVAIGLTDVLINCNWAKRVLFLCDRRELRKQAYNAFGEHLPAEDRIYVSSKTSGDINKRIYFSTYPAMMKCFQNFDVGFFDLIIADESHRSIYNRYRNLFLYFDAYQLGLTATPRGNITHDTYKLFDCPKLKPDACYSYEEAVRHNPPYLTYYNAVSVTTNFKRKGIKYAEMTADQQQEADDQVENPELIDFSKEVIGTAVFNKGTDQIIMRNLMENGIKGIDGQKIGKTIVFARNHKHAVQLMHVTEEMYPQYMEKNKPFCAVIDNYVDRADSLIDDFKGIGNNDNLRVAISVDMLDTGIDVPEIVNLVFAKPVKSPVKFWQMIGRGTRLCKDLFGAGKDKGCFYIFDHWGNFDYFRENPKEIEPSPTKSLLQKVFETRLDAAVATLGQQNLEVFELMTTLIEEDVRSLPEDSIAIKEKWRQVKIVKQPGVIKQFDATIVNSLYMEIAGLMQWRGLLKGSEDAYRFDYVVCQLQKSKLNGDSSFNDFKDIICEQIACLPINLSQVKEKIQWINKVKENSFWQTATVLDFEKMRVDMRGIMKLRDKTPTVKQEPLYLDITDGEIKITMIKPLFEGQEQTGYNESMKKLFEEMTYDSPVVEKIKQGESVTQKEIQELGRLMDEHGKNDLTRAAAEFGKEYRVDVDNGSMTDVLKKIDGASAEEVNKIFNEFIQNTPNLSASQIRFLEMIKKHISMYGELRIDQLYDAPFTSINGNGIDGVFTQVNMAKAVIRLVQTANHMILSA
jgi:type I restriction enzyme R subunit